MITVTLVELIGGILLSIPIYAIVFTVTERILVSRGLIKKEKSE